MKADTAKPLISSWPQVKRFLYIFIPLAALVILATVSFHTVNAERKIEEVFIHDLYQSELLAEIISDKLDLVVSDLKILAEIESLQSYLAGDPSQYKDASYDFRSFSSRRRIYDQIRFLDESGMEIIRVNFNNGTPTIVPEDQLQEKGGRYYFEDTYKLEPGNVFVSPFDLNIEHGEIEQPLKPMIRLGTPVIDNLGQKRGVIVLNYFGDNMIQRLEIEELNHLFQSMLLNSDGYWLKGPTPEDEWGFMYPDRIERTFGNDFSEAWQRITGAESGQFQNEDGLFTFQTIYPLEEVEKYTTGSAGAFDSDRTQLDSNPYYWKIVLQVPQGSIKTITSENVGILLVVDLVLIAVLGIGSWIISLEIVKRKLAEDHLVELATIDPLTNCYNRRHFFELAEKEITRSTRLNHPLSVILFDLDKFKEINDTFGHSIGDIVLKHIVKICKENIREIDILGRYGGEEFMTLLPETTGEAAIQVAERIRIGIEEQPIETKKGQILMTASFGVAVLPDEEGFDIARLINLADLALYRAKNEGRNKVVIYQDQVKVN